MWNILLLALLTLLPFIELRLSIPVGILSGTVDFPLGIAVTGMGLPWWLVFVVAFTTNSILGILLYKGWHKLDKKLRKSRFSRGYGRFVDRSHKKLRPYVQKYGLFGVAIFVALPIPGSGVYVGSIGSYVLGLDKEEYYQANMIGVFLAAAIVTALTLTGANLFG